MPSIRAPPAKRPHPRPLGMQVEGVIACLRALMDDPAEEMRQEAEAKAALSFRNVAGDKDAIGKEELGLVLKKLSYGRLPSQRVTEQVQKAAADPSGQISSCNFPLAVATFYEERMKEGPGNEWKVPCPPPFSPDRVMGRRRCAHNMPRGRKAAVVNQWKKESTLTRKPPTANRHQPWRPVCSL